ncbi:MAG: rhodanese-related sulfurtransferase [Candidatus Omnitrophota bacterium]|jgi:rhodanese-related sulfurtransferase
MKRIGKIKEAKLLVILLSLFTLFPASSYGDSAGGRDLRGIILSIKVLYPFVDSISTQELFEWIEDVDRTPPLVLDIREESEYQVSHIPNAVLIEPNSDLSVKLREYDKTISIVAYCSVGYRSAKVARQLKKIGYVDVRNLEGSIFTWANEGRVLVRDGEIVNEVHSYNAHWKKYLAKKYHTHL